MGISGFLKGRINKYRAAALRLRTDAAKIDASAHKVKEADDIGSARRNFGHADSIRSSERHHKRGLKIWQAARRLFTKNPRNAKK